jgi:hypothetical protein
VSDECLGKITHDGLDPKATLRIVFEYGNTRLLWDLIQGITDGLRKCFPDSWKIIALLIIRVLRSTQVH